MADEINSSKDFRPVPDPTLRRELAALKEVLETRMAGIDKAMELMDVAIARRPAEIHTQMDHLKELHTERFNSIQKQFNERDIRATASERAAKEAAAAQAVAANTAVNAALQAQKESAFATQQSNNEAIRKSEAGFTNEISGLKALINSTKETLAATVGDLRSRLDRGEGSNNGVQQNKENTNNNVGMIIGVVGGFVGLISLVSALIFGIVNNNSHIAQPTVISPAIIPITPGK